MVHDDLLASLVRLGLSSPDDQIHFERLTGGVASDIWRVDLGARVICVKRALAKLNVDADWYAPVERNAYEANWMRVAGSVVPDAVPELLGQDEVSGSLAMAYLPPDRFPLWKDELHRGNADPKVAAGVGDRLAKIHGASAADPAMPDRFPTDEIFYDIRLEPYLEATAAVHPDRAKALKRLVEITQSNKRALVHGDVSPKNILVGPNGPVFLDAECAWFGDPAFDLAFCLNHLLLKGLWVPEVKQGFLECFDALTRTYLGGVDWEPPGDLEARAAALLPGLLLGRVDGKSPVEYLTERRDKDKVRRVARAFLEQPPSRIDDLRNAW
ncbi:MAG: phosphotransferase family protein [Geminicoccaceae bacterium]